MGRRSGKTRRKPNLKRHPAGEGKPGIPYIPIFPPKPDDGKWFWDYDKKQWVDQDPYKDGNSKAA